MNLLQALAVVWGILWGITTAFIFLFGIHGILFGIEDGDLGESLFGASLVLIAAFSAGGLLAVTY